MSTDLRHPDLRLRDIRRILQHRDYDITWDAGTSPDSEWVYVLLEDASHQQRLLDWLANKGVASAADALVIFDGHYESLNITWGDLLTQPEKFFDGRQFHIVSKDLDWRLDYRWPGVARFGRWKPSVHQTI